MALFPQLDAARDRFEADKLSEVELVESRTDLHQLHEKVVLIDPWVDGGAMDGLLPPVVPCERRETSSPQFQSKPDHGARAVDGEVGLGGRGEQRGGLGEWQ